MSVCSRSLNSLLLVVEMIAYACDLCPTVSSFSFSRMSSCIECDERNYYYHYLYYCYSFQTTIIDIVHVTLSAAGSIQVVEDV